MRRSWFQSIFKAGLLVGLILMPGISISEAQSTAVQDTATPITAQNVKQLVQIERLGNGVPRMMTFSAHGVRLAVATTLGMWVVSQQSGGPGPNHAKLFEGQGGASSVAFNSDGSLIASGGDDGSVMVWDAASGNVIARLEDHIYPVGAVAWSSDGAFLASGDESGVIRLWNTSNWSENRVFSVEQSGSVGALSFDPSGKSLNAETALEPIVIHLDTGELQTFSGVQGDIVHPPFTAQGAKEAWIVGGVLHISQDGREIYDDTGFYSELGSVFFRPNGQVATSTSDSSWFWIGSDPQRLFGIPPQPVISPDGTRKATFGNDGVIRLFDVKTGNLIAQLHGHIRAVNDVAFSPDGKLLASASNDDTIQLWDATVTQDSGSLMTLKGHTSGVTSVAFNADGTLLASASFDGTIRLWGVAAAIG